MAKGGKSNLMTLGLAFVGGIVAAHVFKGAIDSVYDKIPVLNDFHVGYAHSY